MSEQLLTREEFKKQVFAVTNGKCCVPGCNEKAVDAHHIMDRKLWNDGGYYLSNGAALCAKHHLEAERGEITPMQCFDYMGIDVDTIKLPSKLSEEYDDIKPMERDFYIIAMKAWLIDKWGK